MTFGEILDRAKRYAAIGGYDGSIPDPDWPTLLKEAWQRLAAEMEFYKKTVTFQTVIGQAEYALPTPPDWERITNVVQGDSLLNAQVIAQTTEAQLNATNELWLFDQNAPPTYWWLPAPNTLRLHPPPDQVYTITVRGATAPPTFSMTDNVPIPDRYQDALAKDVAAAVLQMTAAGAEYERGKEYAQSAAEIRADMKQESALQELPVSLSVYRRPPIRRRSIRQPGAVWIAPGVKYFGNY